MRKLLVAVLLVACTASRAPATGTTAAPDGARGAPPAAPAPGRRYVAIISDLHLGLGRVDAKRWDPREDFRWPLALRAFLQEARKRGSDAVDLVIDGDLLDLWQPPASVKCSGPSSELGCTVKELQAIATAIVDAHAAELGALRAFAEQGDNRIVIIPGNHDAALVVDEVWAILAARLPAGRVQRVRSGIWTSADGRIVVEHGHQIGIEPNAFPHWPDILRTHKDGQRYVERPWGELFMQKLFNDVEADYPLIDNLSPETAGLKYRMADRGYLGTASDAARFLAFNLLDASARQVGAFLGANDSDEPAWDLDQARRSGHALVIEATPTDDPIRTRLQGDDPETVRVHRALDALLLDRSAMPDDAVRGLCDLAAQLSSRHDLCQAPHLGKLLQAVLVPKKWVLASHLRMRLGDDLRATTFVYGHTHEMESPWDLDVSSLSRVTVANSGAFQRVVTDEGFRARIAARSWTPQGGLRDLRPEDLAPCYGAVLIPNSTPLPRPEAVQWYMEENAASGTVLAPGDARCK